VWRMKHTTYGTLRIFPYTSFNPNVFVPGYFQVLRIAKESKIIQSIVESISIYVMNVLLAFYGTFKQLFHNNSVFIGPFTESYVYQPVCFTMLLMFSLIAKWSWFICVLFHSLFLWVWWVVPPTYGAPLICTDAFGIIKISLASYSGMRRMGEYHKILWSVIKRVPINMMHMLIPSKFSPYNTLSDNSMLERPSSYLFNLYLPVHKTMPRIVLSSSSYRFSSDLMCFTQSSKLSFKSFFRDYMSTAFSISVVSLKTPIFGVVFLYLFPTATFAKMCNSLSRLSHNVSFHIRLTNVCA
jgi:hypothetical protein